MMDNIRVTAASISSRWGQLDANIQKISNAAENSAEQDARLLLLPELSLTGTSLDGSGPARSEMALEVDSTPLKKVSEIAKRTSLVIAVGFCERRGGNLNISQALIGAGGILGIYRKAHSGDISSREKRMFPVFDLGFVKLGISICYDNMFPECARITALQGAELLLAPFAALPLSRKAWEDMRLVVLRARAMDNRMFVLSSFLAHPRIEGRPPEWGYSGICCAVDPLGRVIAISEGQDGFPQSITVTLEKKLFQTYYLADIPAIRNRRPLRYSSLIDEKLQEEYIGNSPGFDYNDKSHPE